MDHYICLRIRLNVVCLSVYSGDFDVEKFPNLPKMRNLKFIAGPGYLFVFSWQDVVSQIIAICLLIRYLAF